MRSASAFTARYADVIVDNNGDIETAAEAIAAQYAQAIHRALSE